MRNTVESNESNNSGVACFTVALCIVLLIGATVRVVFKAQNPEAESTIHQLEQNKRDTERELQRFLGELEEDMN